MRLRPGRDAATVAGLWLLAVGGSAYLILPSSVLPVVRADLGVGAGAAGWILSVPYAAEALVAIPVGVVLARFDDRRVVALAVVGLAVACAWGWQAGAAANYWSFLGSRFLGGAAFATLWIASLDVVTREVTGRSAAAVGIYTTSGPAGLALGIALAPALAGAFGWPATFGGLGALLLASLGLCWRAIPAGNERVQGPTRSPHEHLTAILANGNVVLVAVMAFVAYSLFLFFSSWMPSYLSTTFGLALEESGLYVALFPAVGVLARSGGGLLSDYVLAGRRRPVVRASMVVTLPAVVGVALVAGILPAVALMVVGGFFIQLGIGVFFTYGTEFGVDCPNGSVVAVLTTAGLLGSFTAPVVTGTLIGATGRYTAAFGYATLLALVGVLAAWRIQRRTLGDGG